MVKIRSSPIDCSRYVRETLMVTNRPDDDPELTTPEVNTGWTLSSRPVDVRRQSRPPLTPSCSSCRLSFTSYSPISLLLPANTGAVQCWVPVVRKLSVLIKLIGVAENSVMSTLAYNQDLASSTLFTHSSP
ncbi:hypothetical protein RRG08_038037 [Elysia crispata]|uniref:Uncharacterized protein n=1 Tax=Elysia crispata TaxID=231223 RepID=A0AAE0ZYU3_9GAST|nr:hypothetical protein RRG08_038037 [Elysia crispata]